MNWLQPSLRPGLCALLFGFVAMISACAPMQFENAGSPNTLSQDQYDCEVALGYRGGAYAPQPTDQLADYIVRGRSETQACLERKGWRRTDGEAQPKKADAIAEQGQPKEQSKADVSTHRLKFGIVAAAELTPAMANLLKMDEVGGVLVGAVYADSIASRAGIKKGDVILKYGDKILSIDPNQLKAAVEATPPASVVPITIWRNRSEIALSAQF